MSVLLVAGGSASAPIGAAETSESAKASEIPAVKTYKSAVFAASCASSAALIELAIRSFLHNLL